MGELYDFRDTWTIPAPIDVVWGMVDDVATWPAWWPDYRVAEIVSEKRHGPGTVWHVRVKADLPYTVDFRFTVLEHRPPKYVKIRVEGFFAGEVDWALEPDGEAATRMVLHERTETRWPLINLTARLGGRRFLEWNHRRAMERGERGLREALAAGYRPPDLDAIRS